MAAFVFSSHTGARFFCQFPASSRGHDIRTNQQEPTFWLQSATTLLLMAVEPVTATFCQGRFPYNNVWVVGRWQSRSFSLFIFPPFPVRNNSTTRSATTTTTVGHRWFDNHLVSVNSLWEFDSYFFKVLFSQKILTDLKTIIVKPSEFNRTLRRPNSMDHYETNTPFWAGAKFSSSSPWLSSSSSAKWDQCLAKWGVQLAKGLR